MANPLQQQSIQRKLIYIGLIVALFTGALVLRRYGVEANAQELSLREQDRADVELSGRAVQLALTGSRGLVVCILWHNAHDKQIKNQWNELELLVRSVIKLQPHFVTPWIFQSWNLAYNVSIESDREFDQYYYITRGLELLYEGERQNKNHPDLRFDMGNFTMSKIGQGDKRNVFLSYLNMSCIDPIERDPERFRKLDELGRQTLNLEEFEKFCEKNPQLVRRLRDKLRCDSPAKVVDFLARNSKVPSWYQEPRPEWDQTPPKPNPGERFPLLPPPRTNPFDSTALTDQIRMSDHADYIDAFLVANAWSGYSQEALPRPDPTWPGKSQPVTLADRPKFRVPKFTTLLYRTRPARTLSYTAERLEEEGWLDDKGWVIDERETSLSRRWFPGRGDVVVGGRLKWGEQFWGNAHNAWRECGEANRILLPKHEEDDLIAKAVEFRRALGLGPVDAAPNERPSDPKQQELFEAYQKLKDLDYSLRLINFRHFYFTSMVEAKPETVQARKKFFEAEQYRMQARTAEALEKYESPDALPIWKELLEIHPDFQSDSQVQEESYEMQIRYLDLVKAVRGPEIKRALALQDCIGRMAAASSSAGPQWLPVLMSAKLLAQPQLLPELNLTGPFDGTTKDGTPLISDMSKAAVRGRLASLRR